ncbi:MAG: serine/threonine-protein kinase [Deltaproteobacteria bacterium]|nr:serine/threonine-protein kinase [Deltaproteobacteria bacterium]
MKDEFEDQYHFKFVRLIAEGGMGNIYEAILYGAEGFEKRVAIKMVREEYSSAKEFVKLFIGEGKLVADLVHQNIVQIYKLGKVNGNYYIAMEYVHGVNLRDLMTKHEELGTKVPIDIGAFIISRVCRGLEYAHAKCDHEGRPLSVVHRDINPNNLMIATEGEVKITDFGVAKAASFMEDKEGSVIMGKAPYMSPEQAKGHVTDRRSDVFSLGVVMYELLTGRSLFSNGEDVKAVMENVCLAPIPDPREFNPEIPEDLVKIMLRSLDRDLDKRYADAGKMGYDLEYFMYHKGYGPTILTLEKHLRLLFPKLFVHLKKEKSKEPTLAISARWYP